jgi:hypothetical protein
MRTKEHGKSIDNDREYEEAPPEGHEQGAQRRSPNMPGASKKGGKKSFRKKSS